MDFKCTHIVLLILSVSTACVNSDSNDQLGGEYLTLTEAELKGIVKPLPTDAAPAEDQVFRYLAYEPNSLDMTMLIYESGGSPFVHERLALLNHEQELVPGAADSWEVSDDAKTWTFHIHPSSRWSDGRPLTAHDFEYSFKRMLDPDGGNVYAFFYYDIKGAKAYNQRKNPDPESVGIRAIDDLTLVIETEKACAYLPHIMQFPTSSPVPRWQVEKHGTRWTEAGKFVGSAVYTLGDWITGKYMSFELNPYYSGNNPTYIRKIIRVFNASTGTATAGSTMDVMAYDNNEIDVAAVNPIELLRIKQDPRLKTELWSFDQYTTFYLFFRTREPPFDDVRVRKAIAHAVDQVSFVNVNLHGLMVPAYTMLPQHFPGYVGDKYKDIQRFDPELARKNLSEAGYPGGKGFPVIELWLGGSAPNSPQAQACQAVQQMLKDNLGITISIKNVEGATYRRNLNNWVMPMSLIGFNYDFPDPHSMLGIIWRSQPRGYARHDWQNVEFDALIDQAAGEMDQEKRMMLYDRAERILAEDAGGVFLWNMLNYQLRKPWVKGLLANRWGQIPYYPNHTTFLEMYIGKEVDR
ncbi:MAG: peptide ABC transporter substrate-binding protein [Gemmatimonadota bacterium]|nr:peptide ABC transporter substrate-binding protein [Gemmatimonadota bacterium]